MRAVPMDGVVSITPRTNNPVTTPKEKVTGAPGAVTMIPHTPHSLSLSKRGVPHGYLELEVGAKGGPLGAIRSLGAALRRNPEANVVVQGGAALQSGRVKIFALGAALEDPDVKSNAEVEALAEANAGAAGAQEGCAVAVTLAGSDAGAESATTVLTQGSPSQHYFIMGPKAKPVLTSGGLQARNVYNVRVTYNAAAVPAEAALSLAQAFSNAQEQKEKFL